MAKQIFSVTRVGRIAARDWRAILWHMKEQVSRDHLTLVAAGVAFFALLAAFPALAALIALYGLVFDTQQVSEQLAALHGLLPQQALDILLHKLNGLVQAERGTAGLLLALWSASKGIKTLMEALNAACDEQETRGLLKRNALALLLTLGAILGAAVTISLVVFVPALVGHLELTQPLEALVEYARWPTASAAVGCAFAIMYRYGPSHERQSWKLVSWGAATATALWLIGSVIFSVYVANFSS